ncbi:alpha/beta hydrolase family esterase [Halobacillus naozhouensis]|uniref:Alpha/beta hydrolase-fold protein n=1 Tax=Halobacillus naozhouensis TaxID=554880 RepID=A0ABY8J3C2_9BACI|nr:alpha/beta hydrolase-fold protein [Halobacillus naozhouensis]WFT75431.1 alpha/beta hydrolase-fold protein [Halobacillus naozhouensis]
MNTYKESIECEGKDRTFYYSLPQTFTKPLPVLFCFHGAGSNALHHMKITKFHENVEEQQMIAVFPEAIQLNKSDQMSRQWNEGRQKNPAHAQNINDVGFVMELLGWFKQKFSINENRIYATGFSNGSSFSMRLAIECQNVFAGVGGVSGPVAAEVAQNCEWHHPMPMVFFMGTEDAVVPYDGVVQSESMVDGLLSANDTALLFAKSWPESVLALKEEFPVADGGLITKHTFHQHEGTVYYSIKGGGHTWPGGPESQASAMAGKVHSNPDATQFIWNYLRNFKRG